MNCPKCRKELRKKQIDNIEVDNCPSCGGIWCDLGEYDAILNGKDTSHIEAGKASAEEDAKKMTCPRCAPGYLVKLDSEVKRRPLGQVLDLLRSLA